MGRFPYAIAIAIVSMCVCANNLSAQATASAVLQGTVTDSSGAVVPGADVNIANKSIGLTRSTTTTGVGTYRFDLLPAGQYEVRISMKGFATSVRTNVVLSVSLTTTVDASLSPSEQTQVITVESTGAVVDLTKTDVSLPITNEMVQDLPLNGRDFVNLAVLAPGARAVDSYDPTKNRIGVFATNGSSGRNVNVTVNGVDNKDSTVGGPVMQLPLEAIQEFNISTQRFSAANGRSEGAAINVVTKSGTNDFHGSAYSLFRNEAFNAMNAMESSKSPFSRQQVGGSVGGPLKRDKAFLFFALERSRERTNVTVGPQSLAQLNLLTPLGAQPSPTLPTPYDDWRYNGRMDYRLNDKHNLVLSYANQHNSGQNDQATSQSDLTAGNFTTNQLIIANVTLNSVLSPRIVNAVTFGYQYWNNLIDSKTRSPYLLFPSGVNIGTNLNVPQESYQVKWQFKDDISITRGAHTFRTGIDFLHEPKVGGFFASNITFEADFIDDPTTITTDKVKYPQGFSTPGAVKALSISTGNPYFGLKEKMLGLYFQDDWKVNRKFTLNLGLRYDRDFGLFGGKEQASARTYLALKAINSPWAASLPHDDTKDVSPRFGFAYDLTGKGKHVIRGGYGLYYGQTFINIPLFMLQQINPTLFAQVMNLTSPGPGSPSADPVPGTGKLLSAWRFGVDPFPAVPPPPTKFTGGEVGRMMDPNYRNPYTQQWNIGYTFELNDSSVIEAEYVHVLGVHESKTIDINPKIPGSSTRVLNPLLAAAGLPSLANIYTEIPANRSRYDGMNLSYRRRMTKHLSINTSYVLSRALAYSGTAAGFRNRPSNNADYLASYDLGPTPSDERHRFVLSGLIDLPYGIKVAPILQAATARPYTAIQGIDVYGYGRSDAFAMLLKSDPSNYTATKDYTQAQLQSCLAAGSCFPAGFDTLRGTPFFQLDSRFSKEIRLGEKARVELLFQAFDLTNRANYGNNYGPVATGVYRASIKSATFGQPAGFITPSGVIVPRSFSGEFGATFRF